MKNIETKVIVTLEGGVELPPLSLNQYAALSSILNGVSKEEVIEQNRYLENILPEKEVSVYDKETAEVLAGTRHPNDVTLQNAPLGAVSPYRPGENRYSKKRGRGAFTRATKVEYEETLFDVMFFMYKIMAVKHFGAASDVAGEWPVHLIVKDMAKEGIPQLDPKGRWKCFFDSHTTAVNKVNIVLKSAVNRGWVYRVKPEKHFVFADCTKRSDYIPYGRRAWHYAITSSGQTWVRGNSRSAFDGRGILCHVKLNELRLQIRRDAGMEDE